MCECACVHKQPDTHSHTLTHTHTHTHTHSLTHTHTQHKKEFNAIKPKFEKAKSEFRTLSKKRKIDLVITSAKTYEPGATLERTWRIVFAVLFNKWDGDVTWKRMQPVIKKKFLAAVEAFDMEKILEEDQLQELHVAVTEDKELSEPKKLKKTNLVVYTLANWLHALYAVKMMQPEFQEAQKKSETAQERTEALKNLCNNLQVKVKLVKKQMAKSGKALRAEGANDVRENRQCFQSKRALRFVNIISVCCSNEPCVIAT